jgi:hypothetical protein
MERVISLAIFKISVISSIKQYFLFGGLSERRNIKIGDIFATFVILIVGIFSLGLR